LLMGFPFSSFKSSVYFSGNTQSVVAIVAGYRKRPSN
jgi:hypothetical protein